MIAIVLLVLIIIAGAVIFVINNSSQVNKNSIQTTAQTPPALSPQTKSPVSPLSTPSATPAAPLTSILRTGSPIAIKSISTSNENVDPDANDELLVSFVLADDNGQPVVSNGTATYTFSIQKSSSDSTRYEVLSKQRLINDVKSDSPFILQHEDFQGLKCPVCSGIGTTTCTSCINGYKVCVLCNGRGYGDCVFCEGTGWIECQLCHGAGRYFSPSQGRMTSCALCGATGKFKCSICNGSGTYKCTMCKGAGKYLCTDCNGTLKKTCPASWCKKGTLNLSGIGVSMLIKFKRADGVTLEGQKDGVFIPE